MKKIMIMLLCLILALPFVGCSKAEEPETADATTPVESEDTSTVYEQTNMADNPSIAPQSMSELLENGKLQWENDALSVVQTQPNGILITGANDQLSETRFLIDEDFDFGDNKLQRIMVCGLGEKDTLTKIHIFLDGAQDPVVTITLPAIDEEDNWEQDIKNANEIVIDWNITGSHKVEFSVDQYLDNGELSTDSEVKVLLSQLQFVAESIPLINIRIDESQGTIADMNADPLHETQCHGEIDILVGEGFVSGYSEDYTGGTYTIDYIRGRGNTTWQDNIRRPYKIKLDDAEDLFGMGENKHWALIANAYDETLIHNAITYKIGEELGCEFTPQIVPVDVVMNGEYLGSYYLSETIRVDSERVAIDDLDKKQGDENITGGYLIGADYYGADPENYILLTSHGNVFNVNSPCDAGDPDYQDEIAYIEEYMQRVENAIYGEPDPVTGEIEDPFSLMDLESAVRYYWIQEFSMNPDFFTTGSTYCYKLRDGKLYWGPIWDFDYAWSADHFNRDEWYGQRSWFQRLLSNETFVEAVKTYYTDQLKPLLEELVADDGYCDTYFDTIKYSALNNYAVWGLEDENAVVSFDYDTVRKLYETYTSDFVTATKHRIQWCTDNLDSVKTEPIKVVFYIEDDVVETKNFFFGEQLPLPEATEVEGKVILGWSFGITSEDGDVFEMPYSEYYPIDAAFEPFIPEVNGEKCIQVHAQLEDRDENKTVTSISFQQAYYNPVRSLVAKNWLYFPISIEPYGGYIGEVEWSIDNPSIMEFRTYGDMVAVHPLQEGTAVLSATLKDGSVFSIILNGKTIPRNVKETDYAVTDFKLASDQLTMTVGDHSLLGIEALAPEDYFNLPNGNDNGLEYEWSVVSGDACSVTEYGLITAENVGTAVISCMNTSTWEERLCTVVVEE